MTSYPEQSTKVSDKKQMGIDVWIEMPKDMTPNIFTLQFMEWLKSIDCSYCSGIVFNQMDSQSDDEVNCITITNNFEK